MDGRGEHSSGVDDDLEVAEMSLCDDGFMVQVSQDVHPGHILPAGAAAALRGQSVGGGWRPRDGVGEHVILKHVTLVNAIFLFQQRQHLRPTGNGIKRPTGNIHLHL